MIRVRFAPSPTGIPHVGNVRTAIFNWLFALSRKGKFILRIEDTDRKRSAERFLKAILESLDFLGIEWGHYEKGNKIYFFPSSYHKGKKYGYSRQSDSLDIYKKYAHILLGKSNAYYCFCSSARLEKLRREQKKNKQAFKYDRHCLGLNKDQQEKKLAKGITPVIRLKTPDDRDIAWDDLVQGKITINTAAFDDQVLLKSDGHPTYHLAAVVDDHLMKISHVLRGSEWISSTPKHLLLY